MNRARHGFVILLASATALLASVPVGAGAQTPVYRCGNTYSPIPCTDGKAVDVQDAANPADVARARSALERDKRTADRMQRERLRAESAPRPAAASVGPTQAAAPPLKPKKKAKGKIRVVDGDNFVGSAPKPAGGPKPGGKPRAASSP